MSEITDVNELSGEPLTEEEIWGMIRALTKQYYNIAAGNGTYGGVDETENGPAGATSYPSRTLREIRSAIKDFTELLSNPELWDTTEAKILVSQWDNPAL